MNETPAPQSPRQPKPRVALMGISLLMLFATVGALGIAMRIAQAHNLAKFTDENAVPTVAAIAVEEGAPTEEIVLPGTVQAWHEAVVYARVPGYLKSWSVDIGAHVKEGDVLAVIDAPDLDAQFRQAQADLATAQANNDIAQITAKRDVALRKTDSIAQQTADQAVASAAAAVAAVNSAKANLDHLQEQEDFKKVVAPFDGVITARNIDVGALINGGSSTGQDLFHIAQTDKLRVYVQVPELNAAAIRPDMEVELHFPQLPQRVFHARLARAADALDPVTRSLQVELEVDNADGALLAGGYADAHIKLPAGKDTMILPVNALLFRDGMQAALVKGDHVALVPVTIGRDYGKKVEVVSGLAAGDRVVINPPDSLQDGEQVRLADDDKGQK